MRPVFFCIYNSLKFDPRDKFIGRAIGVEAWHRKLSCSWSGANLKRNPCAAEI